jgi:hypothetical protein
MAEPLVVFCIEFSDEKQRALATAVRSCGIFDLPLKYRAIERQAAQDPTTAAQRRQARAKFN